VLLPSLAIEAARHGLALIATDGPATVSIDEWWEILNDHSHSYLTTPADELLSRLAVDAVALQHAMAADQTDDTALQELRRIGATLAALTALTLSNLGHFIEARRWWRSARHISHASQDAQTVVWVRGHEIVRSLYEGRSPTVVMRLAEEGAIYSAHALPTARPRLIAGKAQALAMLGRAHEAEAALDELRDTFALLPADATCDDKPLVNTPESRLRFTESFAYAYLGDATKTEQAQQQALALYPASYRHGPAEVQLLQALCQVRAGDIASGMQQAYTAMSGLAHAERIRPVIGLGQKVLEAVPAAQQHQPAVADFRAYLATPSPS
jgi:tetratricopeptide (TPR) repeat protein